MKSKLHIALLLRRALTRWLPRAGTADHGDTSGRRRRVLPRQQCQDGLAEYVACRKDRDVQRNNANTRATARSAISGIQG